MRLAPSARPPRSKPRMDSLRHQPRLVVKLSPEAAETLRPRIAAMCETHAYAGAILVRRRTRHGRGRSFHRLVRWRRRHSIQTEAVERINTLLEAALATLDDTPS